MREEQKKKESEKERELMKRIKEQKLESNKHNELI